MPKIEFDASTITASDSEYDFDSTWMRDQDGDPATHADKIYNHHYDPFGPVSEADFENRDVWHGFSRAQIILTRQKMEVLLKGASGVLARVNGRFSEPSSIHLQGSVKTVSFSFGSHKTGLYKVDCEVGADLKSCSRITIDEYIFKNPYWDDPNPYYDVNTYMFGAGAFLNRNLPFAESLDQVFSHWAGLLM